MLSAESGLRQYLYFYTLRGGNYAESNGVRCGKISMVYRRELAVSALFACAPLSDLFQPGEGVQAAFVGYTGVFFIIYLFPVTAKIIMDFCIGELVYWRMLWLLPIPVILAYVCTRIWGRMKSRTAKGASLAVMALLLILSGKCVYGGDTPYQKAGNLFKIPPEVCWTCDLIRQNAPRTEN